jgi:ADP-ribose pyrophosphatase YjhB (NUDIX family)/ribosomal protein S27AE
MSTVKTPSGGLEIVSQFSFCPRCGTGALERHSEKSVHCPACGFLFFFNTATAVVALITDQEGRLLVTKRAHKPAQGTLDLPGGFVDARETAEESLIREIREELNLEIANLRYLFSVPNIYDYSGLRYHTVDLVFECLAPDLSLLRPNDEVAEIFFLRPEELDANAFGLKSIKEIIAGFIGMAGKQ